MKTVTLSANTSWYLYNFRAATIRRLQQEGYRVICLTPDDEYRPKLVAELHCGWLPLRMNNAGSNPFQDAALVLQFLRHYRTTRPLAALHFTVKNNVYGTWAARLLGIPSINNVSGLGTAFIRRGLVSTIVRWLYKTSQPLAFRIFCQNQDDHDLLIEHKLVPQQRLQLVPGSGVDLDRFKPILLTTHDGTFRFLYAGRMLADKGINELIAAVRALNNQGSHCVLWLSGFPDVGNVSAITDNQLAAWGKESFIEWLGPSDTMETVYANVDCVVLPSYREGMPRSLLEAGAMGLPVVTTNVPGCNSIVKDGWNGYLCEARNSDALRVAMQRMLQLAPAARAAMGANGRTLVSRQYGEERVVDATLAAVTAALEAAPH